MNYALPQFALKIFKEILKDIMKKYIIFNGARSEYEPVYIRFKTGCLMHKETL